MRLYFDALLELWIGFGFAFAALFGAAIVALVWAAGNPLWPIVAAFYGLGILVGLILPWFER